MKFSVLYPVMPVSGESLRPFADLVERDLAARLWLGTSVLVDTNQALAFLAGGGMRIPVGTSVLLTAFRHAFEAAVAARSLALVTDQPVVAGYGAGNPDLVTSLLGAPYPRPAKAVRDYLAEVRAYLDGTIPGLQAIAHPPVEIGAGVLRPGMARAAGEVADVAITWMTPPEYIRSSLAPALRAGAGDKKKPPRIATVVHVALAGPKRDPQRLAYAAAAAHLTSPHYVGMLRQAGSDVSVDDPVGGAARLVEDGVFLFGDAAEVCEKLRRYEAAGVDEVILNTAGVMLIDGRAAALDDAAAVLQAAA